jgi:xylulokinase
MAELLLGIDVGTYSSKGVLTTTRGEVLRSAVAPHGMDVPRPGWAEQDADAVWWGDVTRLSRELLDGTAYRGEDVAGVAVSAIGPCLLPLNEQGRPLRKGILYGVDTRASAEIELLNQRLGEENVFQFSNMAFTSQAIGPKILWLQRHEPEVWRRTRRLATASSYLVYRLTGEHVIDRHTAGHYMPLFDPASGGWSARFSEQVAPLEMLPRLGWSDELAGTVSREAAAVTGLREGTPVAVGAVDALSEAISVGVVEPGDLMIMYGSTAFFILVGEKPVPDRRTWSVPGAFEGQHNLAAGMATTGSLTRWFRDELARDLPEEAAYGRLFEAARAVPPGAGGLLMLPYFSGERTPINDPAARGVIAGLTLSHSREHVFRAILESVAFGIRHNLETFRQMGAPVRRLVAVGGGAQSDVWLRIVSDVSGEKQVVPRQTVGASYGDAFLAGRAAGLLEREDLRDWVQVAEEIVPEPANRATYDPLYQDFLELYRSTKGIVHRLGERAP